MSVKQPNVDIDQNNEEVQESVSIGRALKANSRKSLPLQAFFYRGLLFMSIVSSICRKFTATFSFLHCFLF